MDRVDKWLTPGSFSYNADALVAHVMGMVAQDTTLAAGMKTFAYDTIGTTEINSLGTMVNAVVAQDTTNLTANIQTFTQKFLFTPLGMKIRRGRVRYTHIRGARISTIWRRSACSS